MSTKRDAVRLLIRLIENAALKHEITFPKAARMVVEDKANFELVVTACGAAWKAKPPTPRQIRYWSDKQKRNLARKYPDLNPHQIAVAAPYLPVKYRPAKPVMAPLPVTTPTPGPIREKPWHSKALDLHAKGMSLRQIAKELDLTLRQVHYFLSKQELASCPKGCARPTKASST